MAIFAALVSGPAVAAPTGLNIVPTTDLVPPRQISISVQNANVALFGRHSLFHEPQPVPQIELGLPWELEGGLDVVPADPPGEYRPQLNLKWRLLSEDYRRPALAVGAAQLGPGFTPAYFLVASRTINYEKIQYQRFRAHHRNIKLRGIRVHAGMMWSGDAWLGLLGADVEVDDHFVIYADWTSGAGNALSYGGAIVIDADDSITIALLHGNDEPRTLSGLLLNFTHTFSW